LAQTGKAHIKDVFPNFNLFVYGGVNFEPYRSRFEKLIGRKVDSIETYPASEGFIAFQDDQNDHSLLLNVDAGIFFEFVPAENYFDQNPQAFSKVKTESDLKAVFEKMGVDLEGAKSLTAPREEDQAAIANAFSKDIVEGTIQAIKEGADELDRTLSAFTTSMVKHLDPGGKIDRILASLERIEKKYL
jgi:hypothetical protein